MKNFLSKIKPDLKAYDGEGCEKNTIPYWEQIDEDGYFYELYVVIKKRRAAIHITDNGLDIEWRKGGGLWTNIDPQNYFPGKKELDWDNILCLLKVLENMDFEGVAYSAEELESLYRKWKDLGEP